MNDCWVQVSLLRGSLDFLCTTLIQLRVMALSCAEVMSWWNVRSERVGSSTCSPSV